MLLFGCNKNMASPQTENGYTKIANEILEAIYQLNINIEAMKVLLFILRKTYGWGKKRDRISLSQFETALKKDRSHICRDIKKLTAMKIIIKIQADDGSEYEFNKNYDDWEVVPKQARASLGHEVVPKQDIYPVPKQAHTKETITKETIQNGFDDSTHSLSGKKPNTEKGWRDQRRAEIGKEATRTPRSEKQTETFSALKWKDYFRDQGSEQHGMQFFKVKNEKREKIVSKLVITASKEVDMKGLIDWWFEGAGEWAEYEPEQCFSSKTLERFINKDKGKKEMTEDEIYEALKAIR